jgi:hypothetical protein
MSVIALKSDGDLSWIELDGLTIYISADDEKVADLCLNITQDLELLRETVCKKISSVRYQSDLHPEVRETKIDKLERALETAGVPRCTEVVDVDFDGFVLKVGVNFEAAEYHSNSPAFLEVVSVTHRGADVHSFIDFMGAEDVWERIADVVAMGSKWGGK